MPTSKYHAFRGQHLEHTRAHKWEMTAAGVGPLTEDNGHLNGRAGSRRPPSRSTNNCLRRPPTSLWFLCAPCGTRHACNSGKPIALVCHSPGVLRHVTCKGTPFLAEDELLRLGVIYEKVANWEPFSITDGRLITGQNPASSTSAAQAIVKLVTVSDSSMNSVQIEQKGI